MAAACECLWLENEKSTRPDGYGTERETVSFLPSVSGGLGRQSRVLCRFHLRDKPENTSMRPCCFSPETLPPGRGRPPGTALPSRAPWAPAGQPAVSSCVWGLLRGGSLPFPHFRRMFRRVPRHGTKLLSTSPLNPMAIPLISPALYCDNRHASEI